MKDLDRVGSSDNFNFRGVHYFCKSASSASGQRKNFMESLHSDGSATYLLIIWVEKNYTFRNEIETKAISLSCFSKYIIIHIPNNITLVKHIKHLNHLDNYKLKKKKKKTIDFYILGKMILNCQKNYFWVQYGCLCQAYESTNAPFTHCEIMSVRIVVI